MTELHVAVGVTVLALNLVAGVWGAVAWLTDHASLFFWYVLRAAQVSVVLQVLLGAILLGLGHRPTTRSTTCTGRCRCS